MNSLALLAKQIALYLPLIIIFGVWIVTVFSSDITKGLAYIFFITFALVLRIVAMKCATDPTVASASASASVTKASENAKMCSMNTNIIGDNETLGMYVISYTMWYVCLPMFLINNINWGVFSFFMFTLVFSWALNKECVAGCMNAVITNVICGGLLGTLFSLGIYTYANSLSLINESSSNAEVCTAPSKQTFKCKVYKNGELVNEVST